MDVRKKVTRDKYIISRPSGLSLLWIVAVVLVVTGCEPTIPARSVAVSGAGVSQKRFLRHLDSEQCQVFLGPLGLERIRYVPLAPGVNLLETSGTPDQLRRAALVLDIVDSAEDYCIESLGPASGARVLPSFWEIEAALGNISIGTFDRPPAPAASSRVLIDIQGNSILAVFPARCRAPLHVLLEDRRAAKPSERLVQDQSEPDGLSPERAAAAIPPVSQSRKMEQEPGPNYALLGSLAEDQEQPDCAPAPAPWPPAARVTAGRTTASSSNTGNKATEGPPRVAANDVELPKTVKIVFQPASDGPENAEIKTTTDRTMPANGEDLIDMTLPETITLIQLLDLAGKYMGLNYHYDPREISNQSIALKLHGNLQGEMKVKNLYALLESVLGDLGFAMIRQQENLVHVVKIDKVLQTQPELVDRRTGAVEVGDTVVTRAFNIEHVDILSVVTFLQDMKLSVAVTPFDQANLLLVTCHADRMNRIEQLVEMIDRPGRLTECRFRRLYYTTATPVVAKIRTLAQELEGIAVATTAPAAKAPVAPVTPAAPKPKPAAPAAGRAVFLDTDDRTNRILMIGCEEELTLIEKLIDTLDVAQADPRSAHIYNVENIDARLALEKLETLGILETSGGGTAAATPDAGAGEAGLTGEPLVTVLEATNQLLVRAAPDQHVRVAEFLEYVDVVPVRERTFAYHEIKYIEASTAKQMLEELGLVGVRAAGSEAVAEPNAPRSPRRNRSGGQGPVDFLTDKPQVVVSESTNGLVVRATAEQHEQIGELIRHIDRKTPEEELSVRIYPVENSWPEHISDMVEQLLVEKTQDKEGKIEISPKTHEQITVVSDPNTYAVIVYANQKNQKWIEDLIKKLDKRRPQVLIDVTLVEVTRTDSFEYDLNLVASAKDAVVGNIVIESIQSTSRAARLEAGFNLPDADGNPTGAAQAFYSDEKVQALLTAIQRKNYGRVLAKPKILVDDGQEGQIVTTEETTYVKESIQIPQTGTPITTRDFVPIQASIQLQITPHISEGNLLRLLVHMSRDDFLSRPLSGAPPDKATSEVTTTVFVPDDHTVILGGLVKLNQSKSGSKVPLLGDVPIVGGLFRSVNNSDTEKKLYVFLKANIVRPYEESKLMDLQKMSEEHREAFEESESEFQKMEDVPGIRPAPMRPERVLKDYR